MGYCLHGYYQTAEVFCTSVLKKELMAANHIQIFRTHAQNKGYYEEERSIKMANDRGHTTMKYLISITIQFVKCNLLFRIIRYFKFNLNKDC